MTGVDDWLARMTRLLLGVRRRRLEAGMRSGFDAVLSLKLDALNECERLFREVIDDDDLRRPRN
ncbi:MAG: hypothetical protein NW703_14220 [Nitrospiraceae bacterium]